MVPDKVMQVDNMAELPALLGKSGAAETGRDLKAGQDRSESAQCKAMPWVIRAVGST